MDHLDFPVIAPDKLAHFFYGSLAATLSAVVAIKVAHLPEIAWVFSLVAAVAIGVLKEAFDYLQNRIEKMPTHVVDKGDVLATTLGGVSVALPLLLMVF